MPEIEFRLLTSKQKKLFKSIKELPNCTGLWCYDKRLRRLPDLPNCESIECNGNKLKQLPDLPNCKTLICFGNRLQKLPDLPNCEVLLCHDNQLHELPDMPNMTHLSCSNNRLQKLPDMPKCEYLNCSYNKLKELPNLHIRVELWCHDNPQLFYSKRIAYKFDLNFPSIGHRMHYIKQWQNAYSKIRKINLLKQVAGIDEYLAYEIVKKTH